MVTNGNRSAERLGRPNVSDSTFLEGLRLLLRAYNYAARSAIDMWQFALETEELRRIGWTNNEFRLLLAQGYAEQAAEMTLPGDEARTFRFLGPFALLPTSCFVLTEAGVRLARRIGPSQDRLSLPETADVGPDEVSLIPAFPPAEYDCEEPLKPMWDPERKELRLGGAVVKVFKWPACNQEVILTVFEEEGWPARIDDPLPISTEYDPRRRLHDTIKCLNRRQQNSLIHFRGDGTGEGVIWDLTHNGHTSALLRAGA